MGARASLQRLADKKQAEIDELEHQIEAAKSYLHGIQDAIKALPRGSLADGERVETIALRPGTLIFRTQEVLKKHGSPMHIGDILEALEIVNTKSTRVSLVGSLGSYVRKGAVFTRPGPNVFGLIAKRGDRETSDDKEGSLLPSDFGK